MILSTDDLTALREQLILHEGLRLRPYRDTVGKLTIGVGRNLTDKGISAPEAMALLEHDIAETMDGITQALPWTANLPAACQRVLIDVGFNTGLNGLLQFHRTLEAMQKGDYLSAAQYLTESKLAPKRAARLAAMLRSL